MSARDVINIIKQLPEAEKRQVEHFVSENATKSAEALPTSHPMSFTEAKAHVFSNYGELMKKLAQ